MLRRIMFIGFLALASSSVLADEKADKVLQALQGDWKVDSFVVDGQSAPADKVAKLTFTIKDNKMIIAGGEDSAVIKLDLARSPAWFDVTDDKTKQTELGIYELSGDTLKICSARTGGERPKELASAAGSKHMYVVLKRAGK